MYALRPVATILLILCVSEYSRADQSTASLHSKSLAKVVGESQIVWPSDGIILKRAKNIGHEFLDIEKPLGTITTEMYELVDEVIRQVKLRLPAQRPQDYHSNVICAIDTLATIDEVMTDLNFVYPPASHSIDTFGQSLRPTKLSKEELDELLQMPVNTRRWDHIREHHAEKFYLADCDTTSVMYLAVGEALNLPIYLVEVPKHAFVRWYFNDKDYLNWEATSGWSMPDKGYISSYKIAQTLIDKGIYLSRMSRSRTIGFSNCIVGTHLWEKKAYRDAKALFSKAMQTYDSPQALHFLAWVLANDANASEQDWKDVIELTTRGISLFESADLFHLQARAYAELGETSKAIQSESRANELDEQARSTWRSWLRWIGVEAR